MTTNNLISHQLERVAIVPPLHFTNLERHAAKGRVFVSHGVAMAWIRDIYRYVDAQCSLACTPEDWRKWRELRDLAQQAFMRAKGVPGSFYAITVDKRTKGRPRATPTLYLIPADELVPPRYATIQWMIKAEELPAA